MMSSFKKELGRYRRYCQSAFANRGNAVKIFNEVSHLGETNHWLRRFCSARGIETKLASKGKTLSFFGIHDNPEWALNHNQSNFKIFGSWENIHVENWGKKCHNNYFLDRDDVTLALGFDYGDTNRYLRFPFWLLWNFKPEAKYEDIRAFCNQINDRSFIDVSRKKDFCSFICREDYFGDRATFADLVGSVDRISFPSGFRHNDDRLREQFHDDKLEYLKSFKFNLCPENANNFGYVSEKIFDAIFAGCIPIYWGNEGNPEPEIINPDCYIYLDTDDTYKTGQAISKIAELNGDDSFLEDFLKQPVFTDNAAEVIYGYYSRLEERLLEITDK